MFLAEPAPTELDLRFTLFNMPVRVHPMFWLMTVLLSLGGNHEPAAVAIWVVVVFLSILVHELGHALAARAYGWQPRIVLHSFGGAAIYRPTYRTPWSQLLISAAGPAAGFLLAAVVILLARLTDHRALFMGFDLGGAQLYRDWRIAATVSDLLYVNLFWGLFNLLPILPLDGGHISYELLRKVQPEQAGRLAAGISVLVATGVAVTAWQRFDQTYMALMFAYLAWNNFQLLQAEGPA